MQHQIWFGTEEALNAHAARYAGTAGVPLLRHAVRLQRQGDANLRHCDDDEEYPNPVGYEVVGNVAVIRVEGGTEASKSWFTRYIGIATYEDIRERFIEAYDDAEVKSVMLRLDTPGGAAVGAFALAEFIDNYNKNVKPVISYSDTSVASAGILYGTAASALFVDKYAMAGSIGAVMVFMDMSGMYKDMKIEPHVIRSAPYKAVPNQYEKMDEKGLSILQERADMWHSRFVEQLVSNLDMTEERIRKDIASGKMFVAQEAMKLGLVSGITTYDKLVATMNKKYQNINQSAARPA